MFVSNGIQQGEQSSDQKFVWSEAGMCMDENQKTSLWSSAKLKPHFCGAIALCNRLFRATNSLPWKTGYHCIIYVAAILQQISKQITNKCRRENHSGIQLMQVHLV